MVDKKVQFNIVMGGIPQIKSSLKGVTESARDMTLRIQQMQDRTAQRIIEIERTKLATIKRLNDTQVGNEEAKAKKILQIEERTSRQITSLHEREALRTKHLNEQFMRETERSQSKSVFNISAMGHAAQASGFFRTGHLIRMAGQLGVGAEEGAAAGAGMAGLAAIAIPLAAVAAGVYVAAKVVEASFHMVATEAEYLASSFLGAISQIGGAKNLQEMLVDAAAREKTTAAARFTVAPEERLSAGELNSLSSSLSRRADLGAFSSGDWNKSINTFGTLTGKQRSISKPLLEFTAKMAHVGGISLDEATQSVARVRGLNAKASDQEVMGIFLSAMATGQAYGFNVGEVPQGSRLITTAGRVAGDKTENIKKAFVFGSLLKKGGAPDMGQAGTEYERFIAETERLHKIGTYLPGARFEGGKLANQEAFAAKMAAAPLDQVPFQRQEALDFLVHLKSGTGAESGTQAEQEEQIKRVIESAEKLHLTMAELNDANLQSITEADNLQAIFHELNDELGSEFLVILKELDPYVRGFADALILNKEKIGEAMRAMLEAMLGMVPVAIEVVKGLSWVAELIGVIISSLALHVDEQTGFIFHGTLSKFETFGEQLAASQSKVRAALDALESSISTVADNLGNINRDAKFHRQNPDFIGPPTAAQVSPSALNSSQNMDQHHKVVKDLQDTTTHLTNAANNLNRAAEKFSKQPDW